MFVNHVIELNTKNNFDKFEEMKKRKNVFLLLW